MPIREITDEQLVQRAMRNARPRGMGSAPRWVAIRDTFALGSTSAYDLCKQHGLDPDEEVPGATCPHCGDPEDDDRETIAPGDERYYAPALTQ